MPLCYNPCPDEKGTERFCMFKLHTPLIEVTILAPMKRGLKGDAPKGAVFTQPSYNPCPDEKGTERGVNLWHIFRQMIGLQSLPR